MKMRSTTWIASLLASVVAFANEAIAQDAPWASVASDAPSSAPPSSPAEPVSSAPPASASVSPPSSSLPTERYGSTPDPAFTHNFQMPTARPLRHGDTMITALGDTGWVGVRYGFARRFDAGIGVPYYIAGITLDARYAIILTEHAALSLFGLATVPFDPGVNDPGAFFGFNWNGAGPAWMAGPVLSLWGSRAGIHVGAHAAQRVLLGGLWALVHMTVEVRIVDSIKAIAQGVLMGEMLGESSTMTGAHALVGNRQPRIHPYIVLGARVHSRRFAVDFGALLSFAADAPLAGGTPGIWPWASVSQTF